MGLCHRETGHPGPPATAAGPGHPGAARPAPGGMGTRRQGPPGADQALKRGGGARRLDPSRGTVPLRAGGAEGGWGARHEREGVCPSVRPRGSDSPEIGRWEK